MKIEKEIKQKRFMSEYQKAHINLLFTASWMSHRSIEALKPFGVSWQQFNLLRILRGLNPKPATVKELTRRMIDKMSNASRLVDKLERKRLVERRICPKDRRKVEIRITQEGLDLLEKASHKLESQLHSDLSTITELEARSLNELLDKMRG